jgi:hypothetical protein
MNKQKLIQDLKGFKLSQRQIGFLNGYNYIAFFITEDPTNKQTHFYYHGLNEKPKDDKVIAGTDNKEVTVLGWIHVNYNVNKNPTASLKKQLLKHLKYQPDDYKVIVNLPVNIK